jgi:hypothetical protein
VTGITDVVAVSCGDNHTIALRSNGTAWAFGSNSSGQLGDGTTTDKSTPVAVDGICIDDTGVRDNNGAPWSVQCYPNPTDGRFSLRWTGVPQRTVATVHNALGATVLVLSPAQLSGAEAVELSDQASGVYHVRVISGDAIRTEAVVIAR